MRIVQVLTFVAPGNPFGGPASVARAQAEELRRRGHDVVIVAAQPRHRQTRDWCAADQGVLGFDSKRIVPGAGFSGIIAPGLFRYAWKNFPTSDVVHVHLARDLVTLPAAMIARLKGVPYVVQPHGMVDSSEKRLAGVLDRVATRRVLADAAAVLCLTEREEVEIGALVPSVPLKLRRLTNGVPFSADLQPVPQGPPDLLFCSRLHSRKRPALFVEAALDLLRAGANATFTLVGPDEGEADVVKALIAQAGDLGKAVRWEGPLEPSEVADRLRRSTALVLPSTNEPYPMVVLEALAAGRPVIITDQCGLAPLVLEHDCGAVIAADDRDALGRAMSQFINESADASRLTTNSRSSVRAEASIERVVDRLVEIYGSVSSTGEG